MSFTFHVSRHKIWYSLKKYDNEYINQTKIQIANIFTRIDKTVKRAVNEEVIIRLKNLDLYAHNELALARDLFMFSFYMRGMSFVDMANLQKSNVKNDYIVYARSKTKQTLNDYLLPIYTAQNRDSASQLRNHITPEIERKVESLLMDWFPEVEYW